MSSPRLAHTLFVLSALVIASGGCSSYERAPADALALLEELENVSLDRLEVAWVSSGSLEAGDGLTREEASAVALAANPSLRTLRAEIAVSRARLVEAGLLPDPVIGWEAMNVVADYITDGKTGANSYIGGLAISWDVPRPGEIGARQAIAQAEILEGSAKLRTAQWVSVRSVRTEYVRLLIVRKDLEQTTLLSALAEQTVGYFQQARQAGAATALQEALARTSLGALSARRVELEAQELQGQQALNEALGLPPQTKLDLQTPITAYEAPAELEERDLRALVRLALENRPDLRVVLARHEQAEARLRYEVSQQWPQISIGTGISIQLPIFGRLNKPAINRALRERDVARAEVRETVHRIRSEVHRASTELILSHRLVRLYRTRLLPQANKALSLTREAFEAREVTLVEILTAQAQALSIRSQYQAARGRWAVARLSLDFHTGRLALPAEPKPAMAKESK
jgi:cobalt-zinc-cadmium efflux system outer membrane protein